MRNTRLPHHKRRTIVRWISTVQRNNSGLAAHRKPGIPSDCITAMKHHIPVPVDTASSSEKAFEYVLKEVPHATITLLHVLNPITVFNYERGCYRIGRETGIELGWRLSSRCHYFSCQLREESSRFKGISSVSNANSAIRLTPSSQRMWLYIGHWYGRLHLPYQSYETSHT